LPSLRALGTAGALIPLVLTQPDRPAGRGRVLTASPVKRAAAQLGLRVAQPEHLRDASALPGFAQRPDLMVVIAYGLLLPQALLDWPRLGCINLHASILPRWRGAAPIQRAVLAGDATTGVSLMQMDTGLDTGPVHRVRSTPIGRHETGGELHDRLAVLAAEMLLEALPDLLAGRSTPQPQRAEQATVARKIVKAEAALDWRNSALELERRIRAFNPWPIAEARLDDGRRLRVFAGEALEGRSTAPPGHILAAGKGGIDVATGAGILRLTKVQPPSGRVMDVEAYLAAHSLAANTFV
jgi:methionyl-tRNA formyltransferase